MREKYDFTFVVPNELYEDCSTMVMTMAAMLGGTVLVVAMDGRWTSCA